MNDHQPSLTRLAQLARQRSTLLASLLYAYQQEQGLDDQALAALLGCTEVDLPRLALCKRPRSNADFRADIERIAAYTNTDPLQLARVIRATESREALRSAPDHASTMLRAARDHDTADDDVEDHDDQDEDPDHD